MAVGGGGGGRERKRERKNKEKKKYKKSGIESYTAGVRVAGWGVVEGV